MRSHPFEKYEGYPSRNEYLYQLKTALELNSRGKVTTELCTSVMALLHSDKMLSITKSNLEKEISSSPTRFLRERCKTLFYRKIHDILFYLHKYKYASTGKTDIELLIGSYLVEGNYAMLMPSSRYKTTEEYRRQTIPIEDDMWETFKVFRWAISVEDIRTQNEKNVLYLHKALIAYHINRYLSLTVDFLNKYGVYIFNYDKENLREGIQEKVENLYEQLSPEENPSESIPHSIFVDESTKKHILLPYCDKECLRDMIEFLDLVGETYHIGSKACSKQRFAQIAYILQRDLYVWSVKSLKRAQAVLGDYYGIKPSTYKINDIEKEIDDFIREDKSKLLSNGIIDINKRLHYPYKRTF